MIFLLTIPMLIGVVGLGIDTSRGVYTRQNIENNAMSAIVGASTQLQTNTDQIDMAKSKEVAIQLYTSNRANYEKMVRCATSADLLAGETLQGGTCKWILVGFGTRYDVKSGKSELYMHVRERSPNVFLNTFGVAEFNIEANQAARLTQDVETL